MRWIAADGTEIAYWVEGDGPALVLSNGLTTNTEFWRHLKPRWAKQHRVLSWDLPGHGESGPARSAAYATIAEQPEVMVRLMDAAGMDRAAQIGWSTGCQVALEMYRRYPSRCAGLVLLLGAAGRVLSTSALPLPGAWVDRLVRTTPAPVFALISRAMAYASAAPILDRVPRQLGLIGRETSTEDAARITRHLKRIDTRTVQAMVASAHAHSAWELLPEISVPVLIVAGDRDPFAPAETVGVAMQRLCPNAQLLRLPNGTHTALLDHADVIGERVERFLASLTETPRP